MSDRLAVITGVDYYGGETPSYQIDFIAPVSEDRVSKGCNHHQLAALHEAESDFLQEKCGLLLGKNDIHNIEIRIVKGDITEFLTATDRVGAILCESDEECLGNKSAIDRKINQRGGPALVAARRDLAQYTYGDNVRCYSENVVVTTGGFLRVDCVMFAVAVPYPSKTDLEEEMAEELRQKELSIRCGSNSEEYDQLVASEQEKMVQMRLEEHSQSCDRVLRCLNKLALEQCHGRHVNTLCLSLLATETCGKGVSVFRVADTTINCLIEWMEELVVHTSLQDLTVCASTEVEAAALLEKYRSCMPSSTEPNPVPTCMKKEFQPEPQRPFQLLRSLEAFSRGDCVLKLPSRGNINFFIGKESAIQFVTTAGCTSAVVQKGPWKFQGHTGNNAGFLGANCSIENQISEDCATLGKAYSFALNHCKTHGITDVCFFLLGKSEYEREIETMVFGGVESILKWHEDVLDKKMPEFNAGSIRRVLICARDDREALELWKSCQAMARGVYAGYNYRLTVEQNEPFAFALQQDSGNHHNQPAAAPANPNDTQRFLPSTPVWYTASDSSKKQLAQIKEYVAPAKYRISLLGDEDSMVRVASQARLAPLTLDENKFGRKEDMFGRKEDPLLVFEKTFSNDRSIKVYIQQGSVHDFAAPQNGKGAIVVKHYGPGPERRDDPCVSRGPDSVLRIKTVVDMVYLSDEFDESLRLTIYHALRKAHENAATDVGFPLFSTAPVQCGSPTPEHVINVAVEAIVAISIRVTVLVKDT
ncbi:MAG: hypothetical protein SGILL_006158 [Bacillariaceae sp.]